VESNGVPTTGRNTLRGGSFASSRSAAALNALSMAERGDADSRLQGPCAARDLQAGLSINNHLDYMTLSLLFFLVSWNLEALSCGLS
jgi:hypothetical protein